MNNKDQTTYKAMLGRLKPLDKLEEIIKGINNKTSTSNNEFFTVSLLYYCGQIASLMGVHVKTKDRGLIPINTYAINLAPSGTGKGFSTYIFEQELLKDFYDKYLTSTMPTIANKNLDTLAIKVSKDKGIDFEEALKEVETDYASLGDYPIFFSEATLPAVKQMRTKCIMGGIGAVNLQIDELFSNFIGSQEVLPAFLELYDMGMIKEKLLKNTKEQTRIVSSMRGKTPTNLLLFGTAAKLDEGGAIQNVFNTALEEGFARRSIFGYTNDESTGVAISPEEEYEVLTSKTMKKGMKNWTKYITTLADINKYGSTIDVSKEVTIELLRYKQYCQSIAAELPSVAKIQKIEYLHRYFKVLKISGAIAFFLGKSEIDLKTLKHSIYYIEQSGAALDRMLKADPIYVRLARYIAECGENLTYADLSERLPFMKSAGIAKKNELLDMATAFGLKNQYFLKRHSKHGIDFISGECMQATDLNKLNLSYSTDIAEGYKNTTTDMAKLAKFIKTPGYHWCATHLSPKKGHKGGYRDQNYIIPGFNLIVLDFDGTARIPDFMAMMHKYTWLLHTTKRHTSDEHRFRVIMPINFVAKLERKDYISMMRNIYDWLPFVCDTGTGQPERKWLTGSSKTIVRSNVGVTLDIAMFLDIFKTKKVNNAGVKNIPKTVAWFKENITKGNRNGYLLRYALILADNKGTLDDIINNIQQLNNSTDDPLSDEELQSTIFKTLRNRMNP